MRLDREFGVGRTAAVAEDAPDDEALDEDEDRDGNREDDVVEAAHLARLLRHGIRRVQRGSGARQEDGPHERDQNHDHQAGDQRLGRRSLPGATRHRLSSDRCW